MSFCPTREDRSPGRRLLSADAPGRQEQERGVLRARELLTPAALRGLRMHLQEPRQWVNRMPRPCLERTPAPLPVRAHVRHARGLRVAGAHDHGPLPALAMIEHAVFGRVFPPTGPAARARFPLETPRQLALVPSPGAQQVSRRSQNTLVATAPRPAELPRLPLSFCGAVSARAS